MAFFSSNYFYAYMYLYTHTYIYIYILQNNCYVRLFVTCMYVFRNECLAVDNQLVHASLGKTICPALSFPWLTIVHCVGLRPLVQFVKFIDVLLVHLTTNKNSELLSPVLVDTSLRLQHLRLREHYRRGSKAL